MSKVAMYLCDKCGKKLGTAEEAKGRGILVYNNIQYDLCEACGTSFTKWLFINPQKEYQDEKKPEVKPEPKQEKHISSGSTIGSFKTFFELHGEDVFEPKIYERLVGPKDRPSYQKTDANKVARTKFIKRMDKLGIIDVEDFLTRFDSDRHFLADIADGKDLNSNTKKYYLNIYARIL